MWTPEIKVEPIITRRASDEILKNPIRTKEFRRRSLLAVLARYLRNVKTHGRTWVMICRFYFMLMNRIANIMVQNIIWKYGVFVQYVFGIFPYLFRCRLSFSPFEPLSSVFLYIFGRNQEYKINHDNEKYDSFLSPYQCVFDHNDRPVIHPVFLFLFGIGTSGRSADPQGDGLQYSPF